MISVIIPTYNRDKCLFDMLKSIDKQEDVLFEVLVIDQSENVSEHKIDSILGSCRNVRYFQLDTKGRSLSKNFGINRAKGEVLLFCDDDIIADKNFLKVHYDLHKENPDIGAVSCHLIEPHEEVIEYKIPLKITAYGRFINKPNSNYNGYVSSLNGGNMSFKRSALKKAGYFEENLAGTSMLEEPDIAYRIMKHGYKIYFSSNTRVKHYPQHNGNIMTKKGTNYSWQKAYYFNQYFFMFRNERVKYLPMIFTYLSYRVVIESLKNKHLSFKYLALSITSFASAYLFWRREKVNYKTQWYTPCKLKVGIVKSLSTSNEKHAYQTT